MHDIVRPKICSNDIIAGLASNTPTLGIGLMRIGVDRLMDGRNPTRTEVWALTWLFGALVVGVVFTPSFKQKCAN